VVRYLQEKGGVDAARLVVVGFGSQRPVADNATTAGRAQNRRVEISVVPRSAALSSAPNSGEGKP
jgi:chemotaxis protein MotB